MKCQVVAQFGSLPDCFSRLTSKVVKKILCQESLILISARTEPEARLKAKRFARASQHSYRNVYKEKVSWKFVELQELQQIMSEKVGDGVEVYYKLFRRMADTFVSRKARADFKAFDRIMRRRGGKRPRAGDELPTRSKNK